MTRSSGRGQFIAAALVLLCYEASITAACQEITESEVGNMADTGEDREIKQRANANEAEVIRESKELLQKTKKALVTKKKVAGVRSGHRSKPAVR